MPIIIGRVSTKGLLLCCRHAQDADLKGKLSTIDDLQRQLQINTENTSLLNSQVAASNYYRLQSSSSCLVIVIIVVLAIWNYGCRCFCTQDLLTSIYGIRRRNSRVAQLYNQRRTIYHLTYYMLIL